MSKLIKGFKKRLFQQVLNNFTRDSSIVERIERQMFFFHAFKLLSFNGINGVYMEFGCRGGRSLGLAYHEAKKANYQTKFYAFDSFSGLPPKKSAKDDHPNWNEGALSSSLEQFHAHCKKRGVPRDHYQAVPGFFSESLSGSEAEQLPGNIAFAYVDCDMYSSTRDVLQFLVPRFKQGMILAFDDYFLYSQSQISGERRALLEAMHGNTEWNLLVYKSFGLAGMSFIVEKRSLIDV